MAITGMDIPQVRDLGNLLTGSVQEQLQNVISSVSTALEGTTWVGPDRDQFQSNWYDLYVGQLQQVAQALNDFGGLAMTQAQQQEDASSAAF